MKWLSAICDTVRQGKSWHREHVIRTGKQRSTKGAGCTAWMEDNKWHVNLVRSVLGRWRLGKQSWWNDNIKVDLRGKSWGNNVSGIGWEWYCKALWRMLGIVLSHCTLA